jgi:hypothetical protein
MKPKSFWQRIGLHNWLLPKDSEQTLSATSVSGLTPNDVFGYIIEKFRESVQQLSFANRMVFYHEYIICFNPDDYQEFMENKKGIFGLIVQESVRQFYKILQEYRAQGKTVEPSASKWVFRFVSHPDYARGDKSFIGRLLPGGQQQTENLRVTFIPRQTGLAETFDINPDILKGFHFYSEGYYEVPYRTDLTESSGAPPSAGPAAYAGHAFARLETILPDKAFAGKKLEYLMQDSDITICGQDANPGQAAQFRIPSDWVDTPHLRIRYQSSDGRLMLAAFGAKTLLNEKLLSRSTPAQPQWTELPINSRLMLNGIVGINVFKP